MMTYSVNCLASSSEGNAHLINFYNGSVLDGNLAFTILLDAGLPYGKILVLNNFNRIDVCVYTHEHKDHALGIDGLKRVGTKIIAPSEKPQSYTKYSNDLEIVTFPVSHGECLCNGVLITDIELGNAILYLTDFTICKYSFKKRKIRTLMIECNYCNQKIEKAVNEAKEKEIRQLNTHMSMENLIKTIPAIINVEELQEIYLMHLSDKYSDEDVMISEITKIVPEYTKVFVCKKNGGVRYGR